jgi:hypothetical protein
VLPEAIKPGEILEIVPTYKVGGNNLFLFYNGVLCIEGDKFQYTEIGKEGAVSTTIKLNFEMRKDDEIAFFVFDLG